MWVSRNTGRSVIACKNGVVATSQPLAAQVGISILNDGGNAIDAAIAMAATLMVVEPMSTGIGGDAFALIAPNGNTDRLVALNASGRSGSAMTLDKLQQLGFTEIPLVDGYPITVPGALHGWCELLERFGSLELNEVLKPAIHYAKEGFPVSEIIAHQWNMLVPKLSRTPEAATTFLFDGRAPAFGDVFKQPNLGTSLQVIAEEGPDVFYEGEIGDKIVAAVQKYQGFLEKDDLSNHLDGATWEEPISTDYRGHTIFECGPNGQGIAALIGLNILENFELGKWGSVEHLHPQIEAVKLSYADLHRYNADPAKVPVPTNGLLSKDYANSRRNLISFTESLDQPNPGIPSFGEDTIYIAVVDQDRNSISFINSLFYGFGSGIVAEGTGIALQCRGALFSLDPSHPNVVGPNKRPFQTIIPGMIAKNGDLELVFGIMGGEHQALAHLQVVSNIIDYNLNVQEAVEAPRFHYSFMNGTTTLEAGFPPETAGKLRNIGHQLDTVSNRQFGGGQLIAINHDRDILLAGSDPRKDGCAIGY